ncbi:hypothetical protein CBL_12912 [Carabus blaptoides fortunei]
MIIQRRIHCLRKDLKAHQRMSSTKVLALLVHEKGDSISFPFQPAACFIIFLSFAPPKLCASSPKSNFTLSAANPVDHHEASPSSSVNHEESCRQLNLIKVCHGTRYRDVTSLVEDTIGVALGALINRLTPSAATVRRGARGPTLGLYTRAVILLTLIFYYALCTPLVISNPSLGCPVVSLKPAKQVQVLTADRLGSNPGMCGRGCIYQQASIIPHS